MRESVAPVTTATATSRAGKIAAGGGLKASWLGAIDRSGEGLGEQGGGRVDSVVRRSAELRKSVGGGKVEWGATKTSMGEGAPAPRAGGAPQPLSSASSPARARGARDEKGSMSVQQWQDGLSSKGSTKSSQLDKYMTDNS